VKAVGHGRAAEFTREVVGILARHSGAEDGWSGYLVTGSAGDHSEA
jgi:glutamate/tyrosine decarboxylase-like PLP-dependent enzyme